MLSSPCLDQTLRDSGVGRFEDHFKVTHLSVGHSMSFDFHISFL